MEIYEYPLKSGITRTPEFECKKLASFAVNVGLKCGHGCLYCGTGAVLRTHGVFREIGRSPFETGHAIVDPDSVERIARDARRIRRRGLVQFCMLVDGWPPEAQGYDLGRRCLEAILSQPGWTVRILTKNAAVARDFDLIERHRDRVLVGLSITGTPDRTNLISVIEPYASPIPERMAALQEAHARDLRTYAMLCPLLPGIADAAEQTDELVQFAEQCGVEESFAEPVNRRGNGLKLTQDALNEQGCHAEAAAIGRIRREAKWSRYVVDLIKNFQHSVRKHYDIHKLRILLYPSGLSPADVARIRQDNAGVIWLGNDTPPIAESTHAKD